MTSSNDPPELWITPTSKWVLATLRDGRKIRFVLQQQDEDNSVLTFRDASDNMIAIPRDIKLESNNAFIKPIAHIAFLLHRDQHYVLRQNGAWIASFTDFGDSGQWLHLIRTGTECKLKMYKVMGS